MNPLWSDITAFVLELLKVLIAPAAALVGALGVGALANRRAAERDRAQRVEARRDAGRALMVELVRAGEQWSTANLSMLVGGMATSDGGSLTSPEREADAEKVGVLRDRLDTALVELLLRIDDPALRESIEKCRATISRAPEYTQPIWIALMEKKKPTRDQISAVFEYVRTVNLELRETETVAARYFATPVE